MLCLQLGGLSSTTICALTRINRTLVCNMVSLFMRSLRPLSARASSSRICGSTSSVKSALYLRTVASSTRRNTYDNTSDKDRWYVLEGLARSFSSTLATLGRS